MMMSPLKEVDRAFAHGLLLERVGLLRLPAMVALFEPVPERGETVFKVARFALSVSSEFIDSGLELGEIGGDPRHCLHGSLSVAARQGFTPASVSGRRPVVFIG